MSHSKRNTSLAFFTAHERAEVSQSWGSRSARLTRDSFLPLDSCRLCLRRANDPVACISRGDIFCRSCMVENLVAQKAEHERLVRDGERRKVAEEEIRREREAEEDERRIRDFEKVSNGVGVQRGQASTHGQSTDRGTKRKLEDRVAENDTDEKLKARKAIEDEKAAQPALKSFWVPGTLDRDSKGGNVAPSNTTVLALPSAGTAETPIRAVTLCPCSEPSQPHTSSLKDIVPVKFHTNDKDKDKDGQAAPLCPSCTKPLTNTTKALLSIPCGHVICRPCTVKFITPFPHLFNPVGWIDSSKAKENEKEAAPTKDIRDYDHDHPRCYVCDEDLTPALDEDDGTKKKKKKKVYHGIVEIKTDGTGFAGGGKNVVKKSGVAFQFG